MGIGVGVLSSASSVPLPMPDASADGMTERAVVTRRSAMVPTRRKPNAFPPSVRMALAMTGCTAWAMKKSGTTVKTSPPNEISVCRR